MHGCLQRNWFEVCLFGKSLDNEVRISVFFFFSPWLIFRLLLYYFNLCFPCNTIYIPFSFPPFLSSVYALVISPFLPPSSLPAFLPFCPLCMYLLPIYSIILSPHLHTAKKINLLVIYNYLFLLNARHGPLGSERQSLLWRHNTMQWQKKCLSRPI